MRIAGSYLDGKTSRCQDAHLEVLNDAAQTIRLFVSNTNDGTIEEKKIEHNDLKILSRLGDTPREVLLGQDGQLFMTNDHDAIDLLVKSHIKLKSTSYIHQLETNNLLIILALITTIITGWGTVVYGVPTSAKFIADQLPDSTWVKWGSSLSLLDETAFEPSIIDEKRQKEIIELISPYLEDYKKLNPKLNFRSGMHANALALPGGDIVFTDDFVNLVEDDQELLAVFFHEVGHLKYKHIIRRTLQDSMLTLLLILITGDVESFDLIAGLPTLILDLSYSREFEREADAFALEQLHTYNIPVDSFSTVMMRLEKYYTEVNQCDNKKEGEIITRNNTEDEHSDKKSMLDYLSTHPGTHDRVEMVKQFKLDHGLNN